ncbi:MAG: lipid-A-disaccharide synthase [Pseudomonadota bacterium]
MTAPPDARATTSVFIITGEHSGDALGAALMPSLREKLGREVTFAGLGGAQMEAQGLTSIFPLDDVVVMGPVAIVKAYRRLRRRALECVDAAVSAKPDILVIIDAPEFTHPIAKRVRAQRPDIPIVNYVSPSVWAWRPGRARKMRPYVDHLLALLPFEPDAHARLGGPPCTYVGHPLSERIDSIRAIWPAPLMERLGLNPRKRRLVVLPGSRASEVARLMAPFGETVAALAEAGHDLEVVIPAVPRQRDAITDAAKSWTVQPHIVTGDTEKWQAFRWADVALAASGTVTLELAVAGTPMVVAYKVEPAAALLRFLVNVPSIVLANLVLDDTPFPEFIQERCRADLMAAAVGELLTGGPALERQQAALARVPEIMKPDAVSPSARAAAVVADVLAAGPDHQS